MLGKKASGENFRLVGKIDHVLRVCSTGVAIESEEKAGLARISYQNDGKEAKLKARVSRNSEGVYRNRDFLCCGWLLNLYYWWNIKVKMTRVHCKREIEQKIKLQDLWTECPSPSSFHPIYLFHFSSKSLLHVLRSPTFFMLLNTLLSSLYPACH